MHTWPRLMQIRGRLDQRGRGSVWVFFGGGGSEETGRIEQYVSIDVALSVLQALRNRRCAKAPAPPSGNLHIQRVSPDGGADRHNRMRRSSTLCRRCVSGAALPAPTLTRICRSLMRAPTTVSGNAKSSVGEKS